MKIKKITMLTLLATFAIICSLSTISAANHTISDTDTGGILQGVADTGDGDTLTLNPGTYNKINQDTNITITKNITIQGNGPKEQVIIDAQGLSRIFAIGYNNLNVTFINITFINGIDAYGGAIDVGFNHMEAINCDFINNSATNFAGAISVNGYYGNSSANLVDCNFINNSATEFGGAIVNIHDSLITITGCDFINNTVGNNISRMAGAIYNGYNSNMTITGCNFINNTAGYAGAVINSGGSSMIIINSNFNNNHAAQVGSTSGGAIVNTHANLTIINSSFNNNSAMNGGAVYTIGNGNVNVIDSNFTNNTATVNGGAICNTGTSTGGTSNLNVTNSNFINNSAEGNGGAIANGGNTSIISSNFINNSAERNGGAIANGDNIYIINSNFLNNSANGRGDTISSNGTLLGSGNTIDYQTNLTIINTIISANRVTITVKALDDQGNIIVGATIKFYVNGKLVGSAITNNEGIAQFTYTANSSGLQNIIASMPEFNSTNTLATTAIHLAANNSTSVNVVLEKGTVIVVSTPTISEGKKTNIKVTLKDINGNILKNKKVSLKINGKTYTATTNNKGIAVFKIAGLKGGKHTLTVKFAGDNNYKASTITKIQKVNPKSNLGIISIKKLSTNKRLSTCKVTIANKGSLKSKATVLALFHMRKGIKIKTKYIKIKSIAPGKKISIIVSYFPDKANHRYCKAYFQIDPKNKNNEIILANNKKSISLKH